MFQHHHDRNAWRFHRRIGNEQGIVALVEGQLAHIKRGLGTARDALGSAGFPGDAVVELELRHHATRGTGRPVQHRDHRFGHSGQMLWAGNNRCPRHGTGLEHLRRIETTLAGTQKMRFHLQPTVGEHRGGPSQLQWRDHPEALPDAGDDGFTRKPHLVAGGAFP